MRLLLAGTRSFGVAAFDAIVNEGHDVCAVWAPTDDKLWRHTTARRQRTGDPWEGRVQDRWPHGDIRGLDADLIVCAHSHDFVSGKARAATKLGGIGYHPSLLPRHRGRDAVRWTVHMRDPVAGGSVYWLTDNVDGGPIAAQRHVLVPPGWDASKLWQKELFPLGVQLLVAALRDLDNGIIKEVPQNEKCASWEPAMDVPPLHRPELTAIGSGVNGYRHVVTEGALTS